MDKRSQNRNLWKKRPRQQGGHPLEETATLPAGTEIARTRANGCEEYRELDYDTVFPADCVGDDEVVIHGQDWLWEDRWD